MRLDLVDDGNVNTPRRRLVVLISVWRAMGPRQVASARSWTAIMIGTCTAVFLISALAAGGVNAAQASCGAVLGLFCLSLMLVPQARAAAFCVAGPLIGIVGIVVLDLDTHDGSLTGQIFFCLPVLYAAVHLRVPGAVTVTAAAIAGDAVVVARLLAPAEAVTDLAFLGGTLVLMSAVLIRATVVQHRLVDKLRQQAAVDPLTGLVTRRVLDDAISAISAVTSELGSALILIDVDKFKTINDTYGHAAGDDALTHIAAVLTARCRLHDVVARMGGDELAVLMPGCDATAAHQRAQELVDSVHAQPLRLPGGHLLALSISAGVAHTPQRTSTGRDLYVAADAALYDAKRAGRGRVGTPVIGAERPHEPTTAP